MLFQTLFDTIFKVHKNSEYPWNKLFLSGKTDKSFRVAEKYSPYQIKGRSELFRPDKFRSGESESAIKRRYFFITVGPLRLSTYNFNCRGKFLRSGHEERAHNITK